MGCQEKEYIFTFKKSEPVKIRHICLRYSSCYQNIWQQNKFAISKTGNHVPDVF